MTEWTDPLTARLAFHSCFVIRPRGFREGVPLLNRFGSAVFQRAVRALLNGSPSAVAPKRTAFTSRFRKRFYTFANGCLAVAFFDNISAALGSFFMARAMDSLVAL